MPGSEPLLPTEELSALAARAESALASEDWAGAAAAYEKLLEIQPKNSDYRFNLVRACDELGLANQALKALQHPSIAHLDKTKRRLARTYIDLKDFAAAVPLVDQLVAAHPDNPKFAKWKAVLEGNSGPDEAAARRLQRGQQLVDQGKLDEAEQLYLQLLRDYPGLARANLGLGKIYAQQKRWQEAIPLLREGLRADPGNRKMKSTLARALFKSGDPEAAIAVLGDGGGPGEDIDRLFLLQRSYFELRQWALSGEYGTRLMAVLPPQDGLREEALKLIQEARIRGELEEAEKLAAGGRTDESLIAYRQVADRHAEVPMVWLALGSALGQAGRQGDATVALREAWGHHPDNLDIRTALSRAVIKTSDEQEILDHVHAATSHGRGDFEALRWLARRHGERGEWVECRDAARRALEFDRTSASARALFVRALLNLDQLEEALSEADTLLAAGEKRAEALHLKADALMRLSRVDEAITLYCRALGESRRNRPVIERLDAALLANRIDDYPLQSLDELPLAIDPAQIDQLMQPFLSSEIDDFGWARRERKVWRQAVDRTAGGEQSTRDRQLIEQEYAVWATMGFDRYRTDRKDLTGSLWAWRGRRLFLDGGAAARVRAVLLSRVLDELKPRRVLEVGSGNGINLLTLAGAYPDIEFTGIELTQEGVDEAARAQCDAEVANILKKYSPAQVVEPAAISRINFIRGDASALPFDDCSFDLVVTVLAVEQMESISVAALAEIARVTRGHALMLEPFGELNQGGLKGLYVRSRGYFRGTIIGLNDFGLRPLWATADFPQETFLGTALVLSEKQPPTR